MKDSHLSDYQTSKIKFLTVQCHYAIVFGDCNIKFHILKSDKELKY